MTNTSDSGIARQLDSLLDQMAALQQYQDVLRYLRDEYKKKLPSLGSSSLSTLSGLTDLAVPTTMTGTSGGGGGGAILCPGYPEDSFPSREALLQRLYERESSETTPTKEVYIEQYRDAKDAELCNVLRGLDEQIRCLDDPSNLGLSMSRTELENAVQYGYQFRKVHPIEPAHTLSTRELCRQYRLMRQEAEDTTTTLASPTVAVSGEFQFDPQWLATHAEDTEHSPGGWWPPAVAVQGTGSPGSEV